MMPPTNREIEILLSAAEYGEQGAADRLGISKRTVNNTLTNLYRKIGAHGMAHAVLILISNHRVSAL
jgi:DNA-binding CsgD family transcriptional regulator